MQQFLVSINKSTKQVTIVEHSESVTIINNKKLLILFDGVDKHLLQRYEEEGIAFLKNIETPFSLFLYDKVEQKLFIAKDKVGIKPLYYTKIEDVLIVGTHLKAFIKVKSFQPIINPSTLAEYLQFGFILQPHTIFKETYKVCSGEYHCFNLNEFASVSEKYWELESCYYQKKSLDEESDILFKTDNLLNRIVEKETQSSSFGLSLSGGYDSSTLVAMAQKQSNKKVDTFTIGFDDEKINEAHDAKKIANFLGTNHHEHYFTDTDVLNVVSKIGEIFDEPFADYGATPTMITTELLKQQGIEKLIAGDGGDEVFATAENVQTFSYLQRTPTLLKAFMAKTLNCVKMESLPYLKDYNNLPMKQDKLYQLLMAQNIPQMIDSRNRLFLENELERHIKNYQPLGYNGFDNIHFSHYAQTVDEVIGSYFKTTMVDGELVKSYSTTNALGIALATPFLDVDLIEQMAKVPSAIKIKNGIKKYLLKEIAHQYLPKELMERPKSGFSIPFSEWMRYNLKEILYSYVNKKSLDKDNIFYTSSILHIRDQFYAGNDAYKYKLWRIFIFQLWHERLKNSIKEKG